MYKKKEITEKSASRYQFVLLVITKNGELRKKHVYDEIANEALHLIIASNENVQ